MEIRRAQFNSFVIVTNYRNSSKKEFQSNPFDRTELILQWEIIRTLRNVVRWTCKTSENEGSLAGSVLSWSSQISGICLNSIARVGVGFTKVYHGLYEPSVDIVIVRVWSNSLCSLNISFCSFSSIPALRFPSEAGSSYPSLCFLRTKCKLVQWIIQYVAYVCTTSPGN